MKLIVCVLFGCLAVAAVAGQDTSTTQPSTSTTQSSTAPPNTTSAESTDTSPVGSSTTALPRTPSVEEQQLVSLKPNTAELAEANKLLSNIESDIGLISFNLLEPTELELNATRRLLSNATNAVEKESARALQSFFNTFKKAGGQMEHTAQAIERVLRQQQELKDQIARMQGKLESYRAKAVNSTQTFDKNLLRLTEIISRAILPRIQGLNSSFSSMNTSQANIQLELGNAEHVKASNKVSISRLNDLDLQLAYLNGTQRAQLQKLNEASKNLNLPKLTIIKKDLQDLVVAQKRFDLKLAIYSRAPKPTPKAKGYSKPGKAAASRKMQPRTSPPETYQRISQAIANGQSYASARAQAKPAAYRHFNGDSISREVDEILQSNAQRSNRGQGSYPRSLAVARVQPQPMRHGNYAGAAAVKDHNDKAFEIIEVMEGKASYRRSGSGQGKRQGYSIANAQVLQTKPNVNNHQMAYEVVEVDSNGGQTILRPDQQPREVYEVLQTADLS